MTWWHRLDPAERVAAGLALVMFVGYAWLLLASDRQAIAVTLLIAALLLAWGVAFRVRRRDRPPR